MSVSRPRRAIAIPTFGLTNEKGRIRKICDACLSKAEVVSSSLAGCASFRLKPAFPASGPARAGEIDGAENYAALARKLAEGFHFRAARSAS